MVKIKNENKKFAEAKKSMKMWTLEDKQAPKLALALGVFLKSGALKLPF